MTATNALYPFKFGIVQLLLTVQERLVVLGFDASGPMHTLRRLDAHLGVHSVVGLAGLIQVLESMLVLGALRSKFGHCFDRVVL